MNFKEHKLIGKKVILEKYDGYGENLSIDNNVSSFTAKVEKTESGIFIPTQMQENKNFFMGKVIKSSDDSIFTDEIVLVQRGSEKEVFDGINTYYVTIDDSVLVWWKENDYKNYSIKDNYCLVDEYDNHDHETQSGISIVNTNNKLRSLTGKVVKIKSSIIDIGDDILYEKNAPKGIHIDGRDLKILNNKNIISYWKAS